jgi:hypothetical protein
MPRSGPEGNRVPGPDLEDPVITVVRRPVSLLLSLVAAAVLFAVLPPPAGAGRAAAAPRRTVVLLDLNYTFVENQAETARLGGEDFDRRLRFERYRSWLLDFVRDRRVILVTARPERFREATLAHLDSLLHWRPDEAWFNSRDLPPAACKQDILERLVFPRHGRPGKTAYVAIESNPRTAVMYASYGIPAVRVWDDWQYGDSTRVVK